jgi:hypothetical protein
VAGAIPLLAALDVLPFDPGDRGAPRWVVATSGSLFVLAGGALGARGSSAVWARAASAMLGPAIVLGMAAILNWVAFGPGPRGCTSTLSAFWYAASRRAPDLECRSAFGLGALMLDAIVVLILAQALTRWRGSSGLGAQLERLGTATLLVSLSPLIALLVVTSLVRAGWHALTRTTWFRAPADSSAAR